MTALCPAPTGDGPCLRPLPCKEHNVPDVDTGAQRYNAWFLVADPEPWWRRACARVAEPWRRRRHWRGWQDIGYTTDGPEETRR